jgi:hypothetical protein
MEIENNIDLFEFDEKPEKCRLCGDAYQARAMVKSHIFKGFCNSCWDWRAAMYAKRHDNHPRLDIFFLTNNNKN